MLWKKPEGENSESGSPTLTKSPTKQLKERAVIGASISITGELAGEEDLTIQGRVEGKIDLKKNHVTVGKNGRIVADICARIISIEGEVQGNLFGEEKIIVRQSGVVRGNMTAPRVNLEDGAKFMGAIDMDSKSGEKQSTLRQVPIRVSSESSQMKPSSPQKEAPQKDTLQSNERALA